MASHPNRNWKRRWIVDHGAGTAVHESGLTARLHRLPSGDWLVQTEKQWRRSSKLANVEPRSASNDGRGKPLSYFDELANGRSRKTSKDTRIFLPRGWRNSRPPLLTVRTRSLGGIDLANAILAVFAWTVMMVCGAQSRSINRRGFPESCSSRGCAVEIQ